MTDAECEIMVTQICALTGDRKQRADRAVGMWRSARVCEELGLGQMESRWIYKKAYSELKDLGVDVSCMTPPLERQV